MTVKIGINGFGRIGRLVYRTFKQRHPKEIEVVAVNDLFDAATNAHLLKYDSTYGKYDGTIEVKDGKIKNYQIIAPTTWNVGPRSSDGIRGPMEQALIGAPIKDPHDPVEVGHVCRSYDSCLVCTVHAHDAKTGEELARFRTA